MTEQTNPIAEFRGYLGAKMRPLTAEESRLWQKLSPIPDEKLVKAMENIKSQVEDTLAFQIIQSRLDVVNVTVDPKLHIWLSDISDRPGDAVLWAFTIARRTKELGRTYTFADWALDFDRLPTDEDREHIWDSQKGYSLGVNVDNAVDVMEWWPK